MAKLVGLRALLLTSAALTAAPLVSAAAQSPGVAMGSPSQSATATLPAQQAGSPAAAEPLAPLAPGGAPGRSGRSRGSPPPKGGAGPGAEAATTDIVVTAQRLNAARATIEPDLGASSYTLNRAALQAIPGGDNVQLNQVILQAPGVSQDSFGQLHIRDDHNNIQYRLNGVILPEGISVFGQTLSPRLIDSVTLVTGALPAQYGLLTAGIVNIKTKSGLFEPGGTVSIYGGSHGEYQPSFTYGGSSGSTNVFVSASFLRDQLGVESPDGTSTPNHDRTNQVQGFAYLDHILGANDRVSLILGTSNERFDIPNTLGLEPGLGLSVEGRTQYPSALLSENQLETTDYAIVSLLHAEGPFSAQISLFSRFSTLTYRPSGAFGDLLYTGVSENAAKADTAFGLQAEGAYTLNETNTLRGGVIIQSDRSTSQTLSSVLPLDAAGDQTSNAPEGIIDDSSKNQFIYSAYLQNEWKIVQDLTLNYGLRFDELNSYRSEGQISPRLNAVWTPFAGATFHGGYAKYFTPPPFELVGGETLGKFAATSAAAAVAEDATPSSERSDYYDVGYEQKVFTRLTLGVDAYYRYTKNLIDEGQFGAPIILTPFNYREGHIRGVELSSSYIDGPLSIYGNLSWERALAKDIESSQFNFSAADLAYIANNSIFLDHDQTYTASAGVAYTLAKTRLSADLLYGSGLRANRTLADGAAIPNGAALPTYTQINLGAARPFHLIAAGSTTLRFDVTNLFDRRYEIRNGTGVGVGAPQFGPRRGLFAGITQAF